MIKSFICGNNDNSNKAGAFPLNWGLPFMKVVMWIMVFHFSVRPLIPFGDEQAWAFTFGFFIEFFGLHAGRAQYYCCLLIAIMNLFACWRSFSTGQVLESQGGDKYAHDKWVKKQKNERRAARKRINAMQKREQRKKKKDKNNIDNKKILLHSQGGQKGFWSFVYDAEDAWDMYGQMFHSIRDSMNKFHLSIPWDMIQKMRLTVEENLPLILESELVSKINLVLSLLVAIGWLKRIEIFRWGVCIFKTYPVNRTVTIVEVIRELWNLCFLILDRFILFVEKRDISAFWDDAPKNAFEDMYTRIMAEWTLVDVGRTGSLDFASFDRELDNCIQHCLNELKSCKDGERSYFSSRLLNLRKVVVGRCKQKKGTLREAPFCVLLTGGSGVGKTCIASGIGRYIAGVGGYDNHADNCFSMNEQDKFMSGIATHHTIIRIDDIAQVKSTKASECPIEKIILLNNNQPMPATVAEAEKKGQIMLDPRVVTATTNVPDLDAPLWVNEPEAIYRRFHVHIEQIVRPEYRETGCLRLDSSKVKCFAGQMFPDYGLYRPYIWIPIEHDGTTKFDKKIRQTHMKKYFFAESKWLSIKELLEFLRARALEHYEGQKAFVAGQHLNNEFAICEECHMPTQLCQCSTTLCVFDDALDSQFGLLGVAQVRDWYLSLEEEVCGKIDEKLREFFASDSGLLLVGFSYRNAILEIIKKHCSNIFFIVIMSIISEFQGLWHGVHNIFGTTFVTFVFCGFGYFIYFKVSQMRQEMIGRYSTCPRPSEWFSTLPWSTKRKMLFAVGGLTTWRILRKASSLYFASLNMNQSGSHDGMNQGFEKNETLYQTNQTPFWGDVGRILREKRNKFSLQRGQAADTTAADRIIEVMKKRQCIIELEDGRFCNIVPMESNVWLMPSHIIPKKIMRATVRRPAGNFANIMLDPASTVKVIGDLSLFYLPELGDQKDLTGFLPLDEVVDDKNIECKMVYNDGSNVKVSEKFLATYGRVITTEGGFFKGLNYSFPTNTFNGLCMGAIIGLGKNQHIAGFHLAGRNRKGGAGILTAGVYAAAKKKLTARPSVLFSHSSTPFDTKIQDVDVGPLRAPHDKCVTRELELGSKIKVIGGHNQPSSSPSSKVVTSLISDKVTSIMNIEKVHDKPQGMSDVRHKRKDIAGKVNTVYEVEQERLDRAYVDYSTTIFANLSEKQLKQVRKISDDANLSGLDGVLGVNAINFASSRGFPHRGPKSKIVEESDRVVEGISCVRDAPQELWDEVERLENCLAEGKRINTVFKGALKDEPTKMTKDKVRVFAACNFATIVLVRKYFLSLAALMQREQKLFECAVGVVQQSPEWTDIFNHIGKYGWERGIAGDYSRFDARMAPRVMFAAFKLLIKIAEKSGNYTERDLEIMRGIATEITYPTYDYFGTLVQFFGSNPSGHPLTVNINSLVNSLYMRYAYYTIAKEDGWWKTPPFRKVVSLMTYGDDNIMSVKKGYDAINHTRIANVFKSIGIAYTMADKNMESVPYIHLSEASFLKHYAVWDDELKLYRCPVEEVSIAKMLHSHMKSDVLTMEQSSAEAISNVSLKYFEFGKEIYEERRSQLMDVAREAGLMGYVADLPSYEERLHWYRTKFSLDSHCEKTSA